MMDQVDQRERAINLCRELAIEENEQVLKVIVYALEKWTRPQESLTFDSFQAVNKHRCEQKFHQCGDWLPSGWPLAIAGEAGELCNLIKKVVRGDFTFESKRGEILKEIADVIIYCDLMITAMGARTGEVVAAKFDEVSKRVGYRETILADLRESTSPRTHSDHTHMCHDCGEVWDAYPRTQESDLRAADSLTHLKKWEQDVGSNISALEGNAFIDGFNAGRGAELRESEVHHQPHPENFCQSCGRENLISWCVASELWNIAYPERWPIVCPICFSKRAKEAGINCTGWQLVPENTLIHNHSVPDDAPRQPSPDYDALIRQRDELSVLLSRFFASEPFNEKDTIVDCVRHIINRLSMAEEGK